jgi:hypothetical protein
MLSWEWPKSDAGHLDIRALVLIRKGKIIANRGRIRSRSWGTTLKFHRIFKLGRSIDVSGRWPGTIEVLDSRFQTEVMFNEAAVTASLKRR